jgi:hypothetical protein
VTLLSQSAKPGLYGGKHENVPDAGVNVLTGGVRSGLPQNGLSKRS